MVRFQIFNWSDGDYYQNDLSSEADDDDALMMMDDEERTKRLGPLRYQVRMWGVTREGQLVCVRLTRKPFFFVRLRDLQNLQASPVTQEQFATACRSMVRGFDGFYKMMEVRGKPFRGYQTEQETFLKLLFHSQKALRFVSKAVRERGLRAYIGKGESLHMSPMCAYETQVPSIVRPMHELGLTSTGWCEATAGASDEDEKRRPETLADVELLDPERVVPIIADRDDGDTEEGFAPVVVATFDIEVWSSSSTSSDPIFPDAGRPDDAVIAVVTMFSTSINPEPFLVHVLSLPGTDLEALRTDDGHGLGGARRGWVVQECRDERELLDCWAEEIVRRRALVWVHYNGLGFDEEYMYVRAKRVGAERFLRMGWTCKRKGAEQENELRKSTMESAAYGCNNFAWMVVEGVFHLDLMVAIKKDYNLQSYSLNFCGEHFCGETKIDLKPQQQFDLYRKGQLREIVEYCVQDVRLTLRIATKLSMLTALVEMAGQTYVPVDFLVTRGQQIKMLSSLLHFTVPRGFYMQNFDRPLSTSGVGKAASEKYQGATVLEPLRGYYYSVVACMDFASLYPSIMRAHNLSHETWVPGSTDNTTTTNGGDNDADVLAVCNGERFAQRPPGILCMLLEKWAEDRKRNKRAMLRYEKLAFEHPEDPRYKFMEQVFDARQKANKVCMNSLYGFCGASNGMQPCAQIAYTVTGVGREMIAHTKACCERMLPGSRVVYGDTDSVFWELWPERTVQDHPEIVREAFEYCETAAQKLSAEFKHPNRLEFEKVFCPLLLYGKKRYSGLLYSADLGPDKPKKIDNKGLQLVRRDSVPFLRSLMTDVLHTLHYEKSYMNAMHLARKQLKNLFEHRVSLKDLAASKKINSRYKVTVAGTQYVLHVGNGTYSATGGGHAEGPVCMPACKPWSLVLPPPPPSAPPPTSMAVRVATTTSTPVETTQTFHFPHSHVHVMRRIDERCPGSAPAIGERVWYVYVQASSTSTSVLQYERAEDLQYAIDQNLQADVVYYYEHSVRNALQSLFEVFTDKPGELFDDLLRVARNKRKGQKEIGAYFLPTTATKQAKKAVVKPI